MLVRETDLGLFRFCPAGYEEFQKNSDHRLPKVLRGTGIEDPVQQVTRWLWAQELRTGFKQTLKATKLKWGQLVTSWGTECGLSHRQTRDYLTRHMAALVSYHTFYLTSGCVPLSVGNPLRVKVGKHILETLPQAVVAHGDTPMLLNTSCDTSNWETSNNFIYRARLHSVASVGRRPMAILNHRFAGRLESGGFSHSSMCDEEFLRNLQATLNLMASGYDAHSLHCKGRCGADDA